MPPEPNEQEEKSWTHSHQCERCDNFWICYDQQCELVQKSFCKICQDIEDGNLPGAD